MPSELPPPNEDNDAAAGENGGGNEADSNADSLEFVIQELNGDLEDDDDEAETESEVEERPVIPSLVEDDEEVSKCSDVAAIIKIWEERVQAHGSNANNAPYNPIKILTR